MDHAVLRVLKYRRCADQIYIRARKTQNPRIEMPLNSTLTYLKLPLCTCALISCLGLNDRLSHKLNLKASGTGLLGSIQRASSDLGDTSPTNEHLVEVVGFLSSERFTTITKLWIPTENEELVRKMPPLSRAILTTVKVDYPRCAQCCDT